MNREGFVFGDSLVCVLIVTAMAALVLDVYRIYEKYGENYEHFIEESDMDYEADLRALEGCKCYVGDQ